MDLILERIVSELQNQNKKRIELTNYLGLVSSAFGNWVSGRNTSYKKYLHAIAEFLGVSVEYLKGETNIKEKSPVQKDEGQKDIAMMFTAHELMVIGAYRAQPAMQAAVDKLLGIDAVAVDHPHAGTA